MVRSRMMVMLAAGFAAMAPFQAHAEIICATGTVTELQFGGWSQNSRNPWVNVTIGGKSVFIGMKYNDGKGHMMIASMLSMLSQAYLSGAPVDFRTGRSSCDNTVYDEIDVNIVLKPR